MRSKHLLTSKMPSEAPILPTQPEKPHHYTYLKEFRTQQCPLFLQHKCTQHRPFTCFHWHFQNQRRRRPIRKRDGTFSYNPDIYCTKYDETTGICPDGDECGFLHRTAGDTERRYHLRYYKTGTCVHETDTKGHCVKNGAHCAFAHGIHDLRAPVYDIRELKSMSEQTTPEEVALVLPDTVPATQLEKDRIVNEDPKWNDTNYVLANYKTDLCKRPPRLCRQGYACPSYHNSRDRRRSPKKFKYRSTPCPNVKHGDDWGDPTQCEQGDNCPYCHTRTEQQFHPEIYKSTKCNDMVQTGYCPRGPFCAFAHVEQEMTSQRDVPTVPDNSLAAFVTSVLPEGEMKTFNFGEHKSEDTTSNNAGEDGNNGFKKQDATPLLNNGLPSVSNGIMGLRNQDSSFPEPIGKGRSSSIGSSNGLERTRSLSGTGSTSGLESRTRSLSGASSTGEYGKAPGSEREDIHSTLRKQIQSIENDMAIDNAEKSRRKQNLLLLHSLSIGNATLTNGISQSTAASTMSPHAPSFYPPGDTVESVIGNALEEDLNLGELSLTSVEREISKDNDNDTNSVCSSIGFPATSNSSYFGPASVPVTIPSSGVQRNSISSLSQSPSSPLGSLPHSAFLPQHLQHQNKQDQQIEQVRNNDQTTTSYLTSALYPRPRKNSCPQMSTGIPMSMAELKNTQILRKSSLASQVSDPIPFRSDGINSTLEDITNLITSVVSNPGTIEIPTDLQPAAAAFLSQPNPGRFSAPGFSDLASSMSPGSNGNSLSSMIGNGINGHNINGSNVNGTTLSNSLNSSGGMSQSPFGTGMFGLNGYNTNNSEVQRLKDELMINKAKVAQWEDGIAQARNACEAWKKEAEESSRKTKIAEHDRTEAYRQRDEALIQVAKLKQDLEQLRGGPFLHCVQKVSELETLPITVLKQIQQQMRVDLETIEKTIFQHTAMKCMVCRDKNRSVAVLPCNHYVLCEVCANKRSDCPFCHIQIQQRTPVVLPM